MALDPLQVERDLRWKIQLEKDLGGTVSDLWRGTVRQYTREVRDLGRFTDPADLWGEALERALGRHYEQTAETFGHTLGARMPSGVAVTSAEIETIDDALARAFSGRAREQGAVINATTHRNMDDALAAARRESLRIAATEGVVRSAEEEALEAGRRLEQRLAGRTSGIASLETQATAEIAKQTEVEVLLGHQPSVEGGTYAEPAVLKTWWSQGDDIVRPDHLAADQQEQELQEPYTVGPDRLMVPGDTSLGAPIGQVVNCRCASVIDADAVAEERALRGLGGEE